MGVPESRRRLLATATVAVAAAASLTCTSVPANATEADHHVDYSKAAEHTAGSQIAKHEGVHYSPQDDTYVSAPGVLGHDVSGWQGDVNWGAATAAGARFVYAKATEGTGYFSPHFWQQYNGSFHAGMIRGAYHFALPNVSSGAAQAHYFVNHGGGWRPNGVTLPGALDIEYNPYGDTCYGKSHGGMVAWIRDFSNTYRARTGRFPTIYTSTSWWKTCTGNSPAFGRTNPLWLARYNNHIGELPAGWAYQSIWQFSNHGKLPGDQNRFNGNYGQLRRLALP